jgi:hypothetical protein
MQGRHDTLDIRVAGENRDDLVHRVFQIIFTFVVCCSLHKVLGFRGYGLWCQKIVKTAHRLQNARQSCKKWLYWEPRLEKRNRAKSSIPRRIVTELGVGADRNQCDASDDIPDQGGSKASAQTSEPG